MGDKGLGGERQRVGKRNMPPNDIVKTGPLSASINIRVTLGSASNKLKGEFIDLCKLSDSVYLEIPLLKTFSFFKKD